MPRHPGYIPFAKRSLGQNFLVEEKYIQKLIDTVAPSTEDTIIEIGPGRGALTESLVASGANIVAFELDTSLVQRLNEKFGGSPNFRVIEGDALEVEFAEHSKNNRAKLVANLPYYISTAILQKLAEQRACFSALTLMFQKEVVDRITAAAGSSDRGYLTVIVEAAFEVTKMFDVPPNAFRPVPKVFSTVASFRPKPSSEFDQKGFASLVSAAFAQKRKTILNNLRVKNPQALDHLLMAAIDPKRRAETLTLDEWRRLFAAVSSQAPPSPPSPGK